MTSQEHGAHPIKILGFALPIKINDDKNLITVKGTMINAGNKGLCVLVPMTTGSTSGSQPLFAEAIPNPSTGAWSVNFTAPGQVQFASGPYLVLVSAPAEGSSSTIYTVS